MTSHYVNLVIQPDPEFSAPMLMSALFSKLHRALVSIQHDPSLSAGVGISFPEHNDTVPTLGLVMRLHGSQNDLSILMKTDWLRGLRDHLVDSTASISVLPDKITGHLLVKRVQVDSSPHRLSRRFLQRHPDADVAEVNQRFVDEKGKRLSLPFVRLNSQSTGQSFLLFIQHSSPHADPTAGKFNSYGLGLAGATVPCF